MTKPVHQTDWDERAWIEEEAKGMITGRMSDADIDTYLRNVRATAPFCKVRLSGNARTWLLALRDARRHVGV